MKLKLLTLITILLLNLGAFAQDKNDSFFERKNELGINTTRILSNVLALVDKDPSAPYGIYYALHAKKNIYRVAIGLRSKNSVEFDNTSIIGQTLRKEISDNFYDLRFSMERRYTIAPRLAVSGGLDVFGGLEKSKTQADNFFLRNINNYTVGAGPSFKVMFKVNSRIYLTTETNLQADYGFFRNEFKLGLDPLIVNKSNPYSLKLNIPTTLFVGFNF